jgi:hypothetical protein
MVQYTHKYFENLIFTVLYKMLQEKCRFTDVVHKK